MNVRWLPIAANQVHPTGVYCLFLLTAFLLCSVLLWRRISTNLNHLSEFELEMASSSSTSPAVAVAGTTYQVFLSFRGPDTRRGFTDVLYHLLVDAGVRVFRDNEEIRKGEEIGEEILRAIEESSIFVPIFSRGYASSKWCLIEFTKMVELKEGSSGKKIIPIFYDVGVEDVKLRTDLYSKALEAHSQKYGAEIVKPWEEALRRAGKFKGWELKDQGHAEFAKLVVRDVSMKLKVKHKSVTEYLIQRDDEVEAIVKLLEIESSDVLFIGISGMGGIGKTTLAEVVFNKLCDRFGCCSFLANVRESSGQYKGIESLQKQLLENLGIKSGDITDARDGMNKLRETLVSKNVMIVLDDVGSKEQIHNLAGDASWFGPGSRIIITTRDQSIFEIRRLGIQTLEVEGLKAKEASRLFCLHAFQKDSPPDDYLRLSEEAVQSTGGLPLALAVIGSFLGDKPRREWDDTIERLKKVLHKDVQKQLMISYEALSHGTKQIFLDIACFFIGHEKAYPIYMWQGCDFDPEMGLRELVYMSLIKIIVEDEVHLNGVKAKKFWMHDQLRDLGRKIVREESFEDGVKPSRISMLGDALEMLQEEDVKGRENVEMIRLHYYDNPAEGSTFTDRDLSSFGKLRYFECHSRNDPSWTSMMIPNKLRGLSRHKYPPLLPKLRWLSWPRFPPEFMGVELCLKKLVILNLSNSSIDENWRGWNQFGVGSPLKVLDLSDCKRLKRTPDLSVFASLERLILARCTSLVKIDPSISVMKSLVKLDLSETDISKLPDTMEELVKLEVLLLELCEHLKKLPASIGNLENLRVMNITRTKIKLLPSSFGMLKRLEELHALWIPLEGIPPSTIEGLTCLRLLSVAATRVCLLPPKLPSGLTDVSIISSKILPRVPEFSNLQNLVRLELLDDTDQEGSRSRQVRPIKLEGIGKQRRLVELRLMLWNLTCIPEEFSSLPRLQKLDLRFPNLQHCPPLPSTLSHLTLWGDRKIKTQLPRLSNLKNLLTLEFRDCCISDDTVGNLGVGELESLTSLTLIFCQFGNLQNGLRLPANLRQLDIRECESLEALPALSHLKNLKELRIKHTHQLVEIPELGELESLQELFIERCGSLRGRLQNLSKLKMLRRIHISNCKKFNGIDGICELESLESLWITDCGCEDMVR